MSDRSLHHRALAPCRPRTRLPRPQLLGLVAGLFVLTACGSMHVPPRLNRSEAATLSAAHLDLKVGVRESSWSPRLIEILSGSGLFREVQPLAAAGDVDLIAEPAERCSYHRGGFIPMFTALSLGIIPQWQHTEFGYAIAFSTPAQPERKVVIPCGPGGTIVVGWLGTLLNPLPGWTLADPEQSPGYRERVALEIGRAAPALAELIAGRTSP